jgi:SLIT-ROBO Rho GTPase activating protein
MNISGRPKLFGGSLEEYLETTGEEIPLVLRSCIRVINLFGEFRVLRTKVLS